MRLLAAPVRGQLARFSTANHSLLSSTARANRATGSSCCTLAYYVNCVCRPPGNLGAFTRVSDLILDANGLEGVDAFPRMDTVTTLWFNKNRVSDLADFMDGVAAKFPNLRYLCFMGNPASPPLVCSSEAEVQATKRYRLYVVYRLPALTMLDSTPVTAEERAEAAKVGQFLAVRKPKQKASGGSAPSSPAAPGAANSSSGGSGGSIFGAFAGSSKGSSASGDGGAGSGSAGESPEQRKPSAFLAVGASHSYDGRHSEGNRFIVDRHL